MFASCFCHDVVFIGFIVGQRHVLRKIKIIWTHILHAIEEIAHVSCIILQWYTSHQKNKVPWSKKNPSIVFQQPKQRMLLGWFHGRFMCQTSNLGVQPLVTFWRRQIETPNTLVFKQRVLEDSQTINPSEPMQPKRQSHRPTSESSRSRTWANGTP